MTKKNTAKQKQPPSMAAQTVKKLDFIFSQGPGKGLGNEGFSNYNPQREFISHKKKQELQGF